MNRKKSGFGELPEIGNTKWAYFKNNDKPVYATLNGQSFCGMVKEIDGEFITLQPSVIPDAFGTEYCIIDKPMFISSQAIPSSIKEDRLEDYVDKINLRKLQERIFKGETIIIIPRKNF